MEIQTSPSTHKQFIDESTSEGQIRQLIEDRLEAIQDRNIDQLLSAYASDAVIFDIQDHRELDRATLQKKWEERLQPSDDLQYELEDVKIRAQQNLGFCHSVIHATGTNKAGQKIDQRLQVTDGLARIDGEWKIVHEHLSTGAPL